MMPTQDPKYSIRADGRICNSASGEPIPEDEPIFMFRARDIHLPDVLKFYLSVVKNPEHEAAVAKRLAEVWAFRERSPNRLKEPDTAPPQPQPAP